MSQTNYHFDGLDAMEQRLYQMIEQQYPEDFKALVVQIAFELQRRVKAKTPHITGRLQDSWKVGEIEKRGGTYYIEVYTNVEYAEPVEYGHRTRGGDFVSGQHMMQLSLEEVNQYLPIALQNWLSDFLDTHDL